MTVRLDSLAPVFDAVETHRIEIDAPKRVVYDALWKTDFGASPVIQTLGAMRSLPARLFSGNSEPIPSRRLDLDAMTAAGFGKLAEDAPNEVVFGISGRFWRPVDNLLPFRAADFSGPVATGTARAIWNFSLEESSSGGTVLSTETRVLCGDPSSRMKFRAYWLLIRPFSGWIRLVMLRAVARTALILARDDRSNGSGRTR